MPVNKKATTNIDRYIEEQNDTDRLMLETLRAFIRSAAPSIEEDWKWGVPNFNSNGLVCWLVAFKDHIGINLYKGSLIPDIHNLYDQKGIDDKHNRIIKYGAPEDIDLDKLKPYILEAVRLNQADIKPKPIRKPLIEPDFFKEALDAEPETRKKYDDLAYSHKKDYIEWLSSAKRVETQQDRLEKTLEYIRNGIDRHAKYRK